ncbi:MAG: histidine kinase [Flavisolibacter sp.]|nr:histidine kinase [Flavisolibacter sp.]
MKRIAFVLVILVFIVPFSEAQSPATSNDSLLLVASRFLNSQFVAQAKVFCEENSNGVKKYGTNRYVDSTGGSGIMYHFVPGVASMAVQFEIPDSFDIQNTRYTIKNGLDPVRVADQRFYNIQHVGKHYVLSIQGIECSQKTVLVELYNLKNPKLLTRIMIGTQNSISKPEIVWFAHMSDSTYKNLFADKLYSSPVTTIEAFVKWDVPPDFARIEIKTPLLSPEKSTILGFSINYGSLIDTVLTNDSLTKKMYAEGFRYKIKTSPGFLSSPGTYSITVAGDTTTIKNGRMEYTAGVVLSKSSFKIHYTNREIIFLLVLFGVPLLVISTIVYFFFRIRSRRQKRKLQHQNEVSKLKLMGIRSQLNPHFIFNALAGIQNLMNKQETEKANNYLAAFSRITRSVLDNSAKELITIDDEVKLLGDYLQMEQLRFHFQYAISVDNELDRYNIEIPAMLLQPFIENAVKHGIPSMKENGCIKVGFSKSKDDLILSVTDNGIGFDSSKHYKGLGLQLSKDRIDLLNKIYKETPVRLHIESPGSGTKILITLNNWI